MDNKNTNKPTGSDAGNGSASDDFFVKPPAITLPKGGGAIRGVDEKFQVNPSNGSASQSIPIYTSPARGGEPNLILGYDSGAVNGPLGFGWNLGLPSITRKANKNRPKYHDVPGKPAEDSDVFILSGVEDHVRAEWVKRPIDTDACELSASVGIFCAHLPINRSDVGLLIFADSLSSHSAISMVW